MKIYLKELITLLIIKSKKFINIDKFRKFEKK